MQQRAAQQRPPWRGNSQINAFRFSFFSVRRASLFFISFRINSFGAVSHLSAFRRYNSFSFSERGRSKVSLLSRRRYHANREPAKLFLFLPLRGPGGVNFRNVAINPRDTY